MVWAAWFIRLQGIAADPGMLEEVLRNLYEDAIKYTLDGGTVQTTASRAGNMDQVMLHGDLLMRIWGPEFQDEAHDLRTWVSRL